MTRILMLIALLVAAPAAGMPADAKTSVEALLAADRAFAERAARAPDPIAGLAPMLDEEVVLPAPGKGLVAGRDSVMGVFRESPSFKDGKVRWSPIRAGVSADGTHGFTFGFASVTGGDPARRDRKYLAYWIKRPAGWRVVAYRQNVRAPGEVSSAMLTPALPGFAAAPSGEVSSPSHEASVGAAEKAFSDRAQVVGLKTAFREFGRPDAMNMTAGAGFAYGLDAVVGNFKDEGPATIHWSTERSFAAPSGDLAVSIGTIRPNATPKPGEPAGFPFFTVWMRDTPDGAWRYIAE